MFCNMFLAYFIFFTGIEQVSNVVACSVITITLHYAFLVSFLWMGIYSNRLYNSLLKVNSVLFFFVYELFFDFYLNRRESGTKKEKKTSNSFDAFNFLIPVYKWGKRGCDLRSIEEHYFQCFFDEIQFTVFLPFNNFVLIKR